MSRTRLAALLVAIGVGAAALSPAGAAGGGRQAHRLDPDRAAHAAVTGLLAEPTQPRLAELRLALTQGLRADPAAAGAEGPREWAHVSAAGDLDGDRRPDVIIERDGGTVVRSGKDGRVLLRRDAGYLLPVAKAGAVRLLSVQYSYEETGRALRLDVRLEGLDRTGRPMWGHTFGGTVQLVGAGPAFVARLDGVPAMLHDGQLDPQGRPALMIGGLSATQTSVGTTSTVEPALLSLTDGTLAPLPAVHGAGSGVAWAFPVQPQGSARSCFGTSAPVGPVTRLALLCDGAEAWTATVRLRDPYVQAGGDFDADGLADLVVGTYGFEPPRRREVLRGTSVRSFADGSELAASRRDSMLPLSADVNGDQQPDFLAVTFLDEPTLHALTLAGAEIWATDIAPDADSYSLFVSLGLDLTGDGLGDGLVVSEPDRRPSVTSVVDGRTGRSFARAGVDGLLLPGLRPRGADLTVLTAAGGRARATVLSGHDGGRLLEVTAPGATGLVSPGSAGAVDLDADGRRDLVVASRTGEHQVTTAFSARGAVLWQTREKAPQRVAELVFSDSASCC